jgi:hypothetical protein
LERDQEATTEPWPTGGRGSGGRGLKIEGTSSGLGDAFDGVRQLFAELKDKEAALLLTEAVTNEVAIGVALTDPPLSGDACGCVVVGALFDFIDGDGCELNLVDFNEATGVNECDIRDAAAAVGEADEVLEGYGYGWANKRLELIGDECLPLKVLPRFASK